MQLERLVAALAPEAVLGSPDPVEVRDLAYDARAVTPGAAFFAVPGERADGHDFAAQAVENGATVLVVERAVEPAVPQLVVPSARAAMATAADVFFGEPTRELEVAGVTGTSGKTTTAFLLYSVLDAAGRRPGLLGTVESRVGGDVAAGRPHDSRGDRPPADVPRDARRRRPQRRARGVLARVGAAPARPRPFRRARLHEPEPGSPRLPRVDGGLLRGQAEALRRRCAASGRRQHRRRVGPAAGRGAGGRQPGAARHVRLRRRRRDPARAARARRVGREVHRRRDRDPLEPPRPLQRRERARRGRGGDPARRRRGRDRRRDRGASGRAGAVRGRRRGAALHRRGRLRPQAGRARQRPADGARAGRRAASCSSSAPAATATGRSGR